MKSVFKLFTLLLCLCLLLCACTSPEGEQPNTGVTTEPFIATPLNEEEIAAKQDESMVEGHAYIHDGEKLHDLMELKFRDPMTIIDAGGPSFQSVLSSLQTQPNTLIISFTVVGYSEQINHGDINSMYYRDYELHTLLRIDEIHYQGEGVSLNVGDTYDFYHNNAWITQEDGEYMYSIHPREVARYGVFRYGHQYIMSGFYNAEESRLYLNNNLWWNEICSDEEAQSFREQFPEMWGTYVNSADQLFEPGFREE